MTHEKLAMILGFSIFWFGYIFINKEKLTLRLIFEICGLVISSFGISFVFLTVIRKLIPFF